jgi:hypothetical protein
LRRQHPPGDAHAPVPSSIAVKATHAAQIPVAPDDEDDAGDQSPQVVPFEDEGGPL